METLMRFLWLTFGLLGLAFGFTSLIETGSEHLNVEAVLITNGVLLLLVGGLLVLASFGPWDFHAKTRKERNVEAWESDGG